MHPARARTRLARWLRQLPPTVRVWLLSATLAGSALLAFMAWLQPVDTPNPAIAVPWWVVAIGFCVVDLKVIEVHFRRESHAFSLRERPVPEQFAIRAEDVQRPPPLPLREASPQARRRARG